MKGNYQSLNQRELPVPGYEPLVTQTGSQAPTGEVRTLDVSSIISEPKVDLRKYVHPFDNSPLND